MKDPVSPFWIFLFRGCFQGRRNWQKGLTFFGGLAQLLVALQPGQCGFRWCRKWFNSTRLPDEVLAPSYLVLGLNIFSYSASGACQKLHCTSLTWWKINRQNGWVGFHCITRFMGFTERSDRYQRWHKVRGRNKKAKRIMHGNNVRKEPGRSWQALRHQVLVLIVTQYADPC